MGFDSLLGNEQLRENLNSSIRRGRFSHFYLICGPEGAGKHTLAGLLAAAAVCSGEEKPCGVCPGCRKAAAGLHPDIITVDDPDKKTVSVELIRKAKADIYIRPNEAERKVYVIPRAQDMGPAAQNALLKVLEEPPAYGVFLLLSDNPEKLLPTVRSRCTELRLHAIPEKQLMGILKKRFPETQDDTLRAVAVRSGGYLGQAITLLNAGGNLPEHALQFLSAYGQRSRYGLLRVLAPMEKWKRDPLIAALEQWRSLVHSALLYRSGVDTPFPAARQLGEARSPAELLDTVNRLKKVTEYAQGNVSPAAICGYLVWTLQ